MHNFFCWKVGMTVDGTWVGHEIGSMDRLHHLDAAGCMLLGQISTVPAHGLPLLWGLCGAGHVGWLEFKLGLRHGGVDYGRG